MHLLALRFVHYWVFAGPLGTAVASAPASSATSDSVKVALVTAAGVIVAAAITGMASTFQRHRIDREQPGSAQYIASLLEDRKELRKISRLYSSLREGCLENNLDPDILIQEQAKNGRADDNT